MSRKVRVCIITYQYPPAYIGGVATATRRIARNLATQNVDVHVIAPGSMTVGEDVKSSVEDGVVVHRTYPSLNKRSFGNDPDPSELREIGFYIEKLHSEINFDLFHGIFALPPGLVAVLVARAANRPVVVSLRGGDVVTTRFDCRMVPTLVWILEHADLVTSVTEEYLGMAKQIADIPMSTVLPNAFDPTEFVPFRLANAKGDHSGGLRLFGAMLADLKSRGKCLIGTASVLRHVKGFHHLIEAFAQVHCKHPHAHLLAVGVIHDKQEAKLWEDRIKELNLESHITFTGGVAHRYVMPFLKEMDIYAFPSLYEGSPNSLLEAMGAGLPIVASDIDGARALIEDQVTGLLVPPENVDNLAECLSFLVENEILRTRLGEAAKQSAQTRFSPSREVARWMQEYTRTIALFEDC